MTFGPGCSVCPWAAARPRAVRAASRWLGASSRSPARPRHRPRAPQPGPPIPPAPSTPVEPGVPSVVSAPRLEARPGPATAHGHRSQALTRGMGASASATHSTAATATSSEPPCKKYRPSRAPHRLTHVLSERNIAPARSKWAKYCAFRRAGAKNVSRHPTTPHAGAVFLSSQPHPDPQARQNSPCSPPSAPRRDKVRPARAKQTKISVFSPAGRILSRSHPESRPAGRVLSRP